MFSLAWPQEGAPVKQPDKTETMSAFNDEQLPKRIFHLSQAEKPREIKQSLIDSALSDGWIGLLVNVNTVIFVGLIALTADFGAIESLIFLGIQLSCTFIGTIIFLVLQVRRQSNRAIGFIKTERLLTFIDLLVMGSWGFGVILFISPLFYNRSLLIIALLTASGIASATLNARLLPAMLLGRFVLFAPSTIYYLNEQPPFWGLLVCSLFFAFAVTIGIGYAVHVQHLNEANLAFKLREASVLLRQQSSSLERSLRQEHAAQAQILKETKLREQFLHSISHDLNQPLSALGLYLNDLANQNISKEKLTSVTLAQQCLTSAKTLIRSVSQLAWIKDHLPPPKLATVELHPLMTRIAQDAGPIAHDKSLEIVYVPTSLRVRADAEFLERVLRNLVHNAIQYTDEGRVLFGARRRGGGNAEIIVMDTGIGISNEDKKHIFEAFFQTDSPKSRQTGNVGLGLSIVSDLVSAMDGETTIASVLGKGSQFGVILPIVHDRQSSGKSVASRVLPSLRKVLFLEDQPEYLNSISGMLEELGYEVDCASKPEEFAVIDGRTFRSYNWLVLDFDLGNSLTAFDILDRIEKKSPPRFLVVSQHDDPNMIHHIKKRGGLFLKNHSMLQT